MLGEGSGSRTDLDHSFVATESCKCICNALGNDRFFQEMLSEVFLRANDFVKMKAET